MSRPWELAKLAWQITVATFVARQVFPSSMEHSTALAVLRWTSYGAQLGAVALTAGALAVDLFADRRRGVPRRYVGTLALLYLALFWIAVQVYPWVDRTGSLGALVLAIVWMVWVVLMAPVLSLGAILFDRDRKRGVLALVISGAVALFGQLIVQG